VSPVKYELGFISQKTTFFIVTAVKTSNLNVALTSRALQWRSNMFPVKYGLGFYIPQDDIPHSDRRETLKYYSGWNNDHITQNSIPRFQ
jgi:hypothetical protein